MFSPAFAGYARAVLCDCDLYFVSSPAAHFVDAPASGCLVTRPNPPYPLLRSVFESAGLPAPAPVPARFPMSADECTAATKWNGGLSVFAVGELESWGRAWAAHALRLLAENPGPLGQYRMFADQTGWALTAQQLGIAFAQLPQTFSYPVTRALLACPLYHDTPADIVCFHLGKATDPAGRIRLTGIPALDAQVEAANRRIVRDLIALTDDDAVVSCLFERWQSYRAAVPAPA